MGVRDCDAVAGPGDHRDVREVIAEGNHPAGGDPTVGCVLRERHLLRDTGAATSTNVLPARVVVASAPASSDVACRSCSRSADGNRARSFVIGNVHSRGSHGGCEPSGRGHQSGLR